MQERIRKAYTEAGMMEMELQKIEKNVEDMEAAITELKKRVNHG